MGDMPGKQPRFSHLPRLLALLFLGLAMAYYGYDGYRFYQEKIVAEPLAEATEAVTPAEKKALDDMPMGDIAGMQLFGDAAAVKPVIEEDKPLPETQLDLELRAAFTDSYNGGSALIAEKRKPAKRYFISDTLPGNATLEVVNAGSVVIKRGGKLETLGFARPKAAGAGNRSVASRARRQPVAQPRVVANTVPVAPKTAAPEQPLLEQPMSLRERLRQLRQQTN